MLEEIQKRIANRYRALQHGAPPEAASLEEARALLTVGEHLPKCEALAEKSWMSGAAHFLETLGLPEHHDPQKNWDSLKCLHYLSSQCGPDDAILDAGSGAKSAILIWLHLLGFRNLWACDRERAKADFYTPRNIKFSVEDLAKTNYPSSTFAGIACVSVIEHGIDLKQFFAEMHRILRPGGVLAVSTDYWPDGIDCAGVYPYGKEFGEMKVFTRDEARAICETAAAAGLEICTPVNFEAREKAVRWEQVDREYTFLFLAFRKRSHA